jgi:hypothetical protein
MQIHRCAENCWPKHGWLPTGPQETQVEITMRHPFLFIPMANICSILTSLVDERMGKQISHKIHGKISIMTFQEVKQI